MVTTESNLATMTPEEFANYYMTNLQSELNIYDLQANKVGFLGYLINLLGHITYDSKMYQDMLFKEAFPATVQSDDNIYLHGSIYGFKTNLAIPAIATGTIEFDFSLLPSTSSNTIRREVVFGLREPMSEINVDDVYYSSDSVYTFIKENNSYRTIISNNDGSVISIPSNSSLLSVPLQNFKQQKSEIINFTLPNYNYGSYYTYTFESENEYISQIDVLIKMPDENDFVSYNIEKIKYLISSDDKTVFFNQISDTTYTIEFGSGIHGAWTPGGEVKLIIYKTIGSSANFAKDVKANIEAPTQLVVYNRMNDGSTQSTTLDPSQYLTIKFEYSENGIDPLSGDNLRNALVNYIQTRDNFLSEIDFYNVIEVRS